MDDLDEIKEHFRLPFYCISTTLNKYINGIFIYLPSIIYDLTVSDLDANKTDNLVRIYGKQWQKILRPNPKLWIKTLPTMGPVEEPDIQNFFEPEWDDLSPELKYYHTNDMCILIRLGILKIYNMLQLRTIFYATFGYSPFAQCLAFSKQSTRDDRLMSAEAVKSDLLSEEVRDFVLEDSGVLHDIVVSDIIIKTDTMQHVCNPFNPNTYPKPESFIDEDKELTPESFVYLIYLYPYIYSCFKSLDMVVYNYHIRPLFPQTNSIIYENLITNYKNNYLTSMFQLQPNDEFMVQKTFEESMLDGVLLKYVKTTLMPITEIIKIFTFKFQLKVEYGGLNIIKLYIDMIRKMDLINYIEVMLRMDGREIIYSKGNPLNKSLDIVGDTKQKILTGYEWLFFEYADKILRGHTFLTRQGYFKSMFKLYGVEYNFEEAANAVKKSFIERFKEVDTSGFSKKNISSMSMRFLYEEIFFEPHFSAIKKLIIDRQKYHFYEVVKEEPYSITIRMPYAMLNDKGSNETNAFMKWSESSVKRPQMSFYDYRYVTVTIAYNYNKLDFICTVPLKYLSILSKLVKYICSEIEKEKIVHIDIGDISDIEVVLKGIDRMRFSDTEIEIKFSQHCQRSDQPKVTTEKAYNECPTRQKKEIFKSVNETTGKPIYFKCRPEQPYLTAMLYVQGHTKTVVDDSGNETRVVICTFCCRQNEPQIPARQNINKQCIEKGYVSVEKFMQEPNKTRILNFTVGHFENRITKQSAALEYLISSPKYYLYKPFKTNDKISALLITLPVILKHSIEEINAMLVEKFNQSNTEFNSFITTCHLDKISTSNLLKNGTILPNIKDFVDDISQFEPIIVEIVLILFNASLFIFSDHRVYNLAKFSHIKTQHIYMLYEDSNIYYPIVFLPYNSYSGNAKNLNYVHEHTDTVFKNTAEKLLNYKTDISEVAKDLLERITNIAEIEYYYKNTEQAVYGIHVNFDGDKFYFPIPIYIYEGTNYVEVGPSEFASLNTAFRFLQALNLKTIVCTNNGYVFALYIHDTFFFIKETDVSISQFDIDTQYLECYFDFRELAETLGDTGSSNVELMDEETKLVGANDTGKQLCFSFYTIMITKLLLQHKKLPPCKARVKYKAIMNDKKITSKSVAIANGKEFSLKTKKALIEATTMGFNIDDCILIEDLEMFREQNPDTLLSIIKELTKSISIIVPDESTQFVEYLERKLQSKEKLILTREFARDFPEFYLNQVTNVYAGTFGEEYIQHIYNRTYRTYFNNSNMIDVEHMKSLLLKGR